MKQQSDNKDKTEWFRPIIKCSFSPQIHSEPQPVLFQQFGENIQATSSSSASQFNDELERLTPIIGKYFHKSMTKNKQLIEEFLIRQKQEKIEDYCKNGLQQKENFSEINMFQYKLDCSDIKQYISNDPIKICDFPLQKVRVNHEKMMKECSLTYFIIKKHLSASSKCMMFYEQNLPSIALECQGAGIDVSESLQRLQNFYDKRRERLEEYFPDGHNLAKRQLQRQDSESFGQQQQESVDTS